ncbi:MAG: DUF211 domain-containing protein [Dehalococcoidia bacterium]|nr:DUF211 domain-containing protein [Dehalococcoidia bacterium]
MQIRRLVLDVLIPQEPPVVAFAERISDMNNVDGVTIRVSEIDERTKSVEMAIEGENLSIEDISKEIEDLGGSVHSIDRVSAGSRIV